MKRKEFIKTCGFACIGASFGLGMVLESCNTTKMINGTISNSDLIFPKSKFEFSKNNGIKFHKYLIVQNDQLQFPICIFRLNETEFSAVLMKCPHQGAELQVFGDKLQCPAHGSEFDHFGKVQSSPADSNLRSFQVTQDKLNLKISLK